MKYLIIPFCTLFLFAACDEEEIVPEENTVEENKNVDPYAPRYGEEIDYIPFEIAFDLKKEEGNILTLEVVTEVAEGSFYLSPTADREMGGRFILSLAENDHLLLSGPPSEFPVPDKEFYYWADKEVKKVTEKTNYEQKLVILSDDDFEVSGQVGFTVEPNCNYFVSPFKVIRKGGELSLEKGEPYQDNEAFKAE